MGQEARAIRRDQEPMVTLHQKQHLE